MTLLDRLVFQPRLGGPPLDPVRLGFPVEDVHLQARDGTRLHAFWLPGPAEPDAGDRALLFLHGNSGDASRCLPFADRLRGLGTGVLVLDYRGYGRSAGRPSEPGVYADARAALAHLLEARGVPETRIVVYGRSLGSAVAVELAAGRSLAGVVLESAFPSVAAIARSYLGVGFDGWLDSKLASVRRIRDVRCPLLFFHGERDRVIRPALGRALFAAAPQPKRFELIPGARHGNGHRAGGAAYLACFASFLDRVAPQARAAEAAG